MDLREAIETLRAEVRELARKRAVEASAPARDVTQKRNLDAARRILNAYSRPAVDFEAQFDRDADEG